MRTEIPLPTVKGIRRAEGFVSGENTVVAALTDGGCVEVIHEHCWEGGK